MGSAATTAPLSNAIIDAAGQTPDGQFVNITAWSGSTSVLSDVVRSLPTSVRAKIGNVTLLSPGMGPSDNVGIGNVASFWGTGARNSVVTLFAPLSDMSVINCDSHTANCFFQDSSVAAYLAAHSGSPCTTKQVYTKQRPTGNGGGGGGGAPGGGDTTFTFSPQMFMYGGEEGYGEWVLVPGFTVVIVHAK